MKNNRRKSSRRLSESMHETVQNLSSALDILQRPEGGVCEGAAHGSLLRGRTCLEGRDGVFEGCGVLFSGTNAKKVDRAGEAVPGRDSLRRVLDELLTAK